MRHCCCTVQITKATLICVTTLQFSPPPPPKKKKQKKKQRQNADYSGKTWVAGKAEPISPILAPSLGEPMLGGN